MYTAPRFCYSNSHVRCEILNVYNGFETTEVSDDSNNETHKFRIPPLHLYCILYRSPVSIFNSMTFHLAKDCRWKSQKQNKPYIIAAISHFSVYEPPRIFFSRKMVNFSDYLQDVIPKFPGNLETRWCPKQRWSSVRWKGSRMQVCT